MGLMNGLTFGGINSLDYGIYISGEAVFNAPDREVEMLQIPGRNGDFVLDHGRFENIEVSYPAGTFGDDQTDFREKLSDFRNAILSQVGYQRLTDSYHPDEYRLGVYASGLEVAPVHYNTAGEFVLTFNCKPQRWLTSGETAVAVTSGDDITNPTLFPSSPLLEVYGYGTINLGSAEIKISNAIIGNIKIASGTEFDDTSITQTLETSALNIGDTITLNSGNDKTCMSGWLYNLNPGHTTSVTPTTTTNLDGATFTRSLLYGVFFMLYVGTITFNYGTPDSFSGSAGYNFVFEGTTYSHTATITITYDGNDTITYQLSDSPSDPANFELLSRNGSALMDVYAYSTKLAGGNPMYIDLDIGEAWNEDYGYILSSNNALSLPSDLPTLSPGTTAITYDNTITSLKIRPRWWII